MTEQLAAPLRSELRTSDGETLSLADWLLPADAARRAVVQIVHGIGEHIGRYAHVAARLNQWGFAVRGHDHFGHGASSGARGGLPSDLRLVDDLARVVDDSRSAYPGAPLVLLGHSLGGLVAASFVARETRPVDGLILSSPGLDPGLGAVQKLLVAVLSRIAPKLRVGNGLDVTKLSHDRAVLRAYREDPLNHDRISARLARFVASEGAVVQARAPQWLVQTLLMYAGDDHLVAPAASRAFAAAAPKDTVDAICFDAMYHEIFNEPDAGQVFDTLRNWLGILTTACS